MHDVLAAFLLTLDSRFAMNLTRPKTKKKGNKIFPMHSKDTKWSLSIWIPCNVMSEV